MDMWEGTLLLAVIIIVGLMLFLFVAPHLLLNRDNLTFPKAQDILYERTGVYFEEEAAYKILKDEDRGAFAFTAHELQSLTRLRDHTYAPIEEY